MVNGKILGELQTVVAHCAGDRLRLTFPDGSVTEAPVALGEPVQRAVLLAPASRDGVLDGPWAEALSEHVGQRGEDRGGRGVGRSRAGRARRR